MAYFQTKNPHLGKFWEGLGMENVGIFYDHLEYFTACGHWVYFFPIWLVWTKKNLATLALGRG
jgi:hypothetical protein